MGGFLRSSFGSLCCEVPPGSTSNTLVALGLWYGSIRALTAGCRSCTRTYCAASLWDVGNDVAATCRLRYCCPMMRMTMALCSYRNAASIELIYDGGPLSGYRLGGNAPICTIHSPLQVPIPPPMPMPTVFLLLRGWRLPLPCWMSC